MYVVRNLKYILPVLLGVLVGSFLVFNALNQQQTIGAALRTFTSQQLSTSTPTDNYVLATVNGYPKWVSPSAGTAEWSDAGAYVYPNEGDYAQVPYIDATSTIPSTFTGGIVSTGSSTFNSFIDLAAITTPSAPSVGLLRLFALNTQGFDRLIQENNSGTNVTLGRDNVIIVRNETGSTISKGQAVYSNGSTGNVPNIALAKSDATSTLPAIGVALDDISNNSFGQVINKGILESFDTSAYNSGDNLWVSDTTAGGLTNVRPSVDNYPQRIGTILVSGVGNGSILVETGNFVGGFELFSKNKLTVPYVVATSTTDASTFAGGLVSNASSTFNGQTRYYATSTWSSGIHNIMHGIYALDSSGFHIHGSGGTLAASFASGGGANVTLPGYTSALLQTGSGGAVAEYAGTSCTNQFVRSLSALGIATCATVDISADTNLAAGTNITLTGDTLNVDDAFLLNTGDVGTGVYDFGGATSFEVPNGTNPTVNADGEIAFDTTDGQLVFRAGGEEHIITGTTTGSFRVASTTFGDNNVAFTTGTSTLLVHNPPEPITLKGFYCKVTSGTSVVVRFGDGAASTTQSICTTSGGFVVTSSNNTWAQWEDMKVDIGSQSGDPGHVVITPVINKTR